MQCLTQFVFFPDEVPFLIMQYLFQPDPHHHRFMIRVGKSHWDGCHTFYFNIGRNNKEINDSCLCQPLLYGMSTLRLLGRTGLKTNCPPGKKFDSTGGSALVTKSPEMKEETLNPRGLLFQSPPATTTKERKLR
jgi:hypothetical protein